MVGGTGASVSRAVVAGAGDTPAPRPAHHTVHPCGRAVSLPPRYDRGTSAGCADLRPGQPAGLLSPFLPPFGVCPRMGIAAGISVGDEWYPSGGGGHRRGAGWAGVLGAGGHLPLHPHPSPLVGLFRASAAGGDAGWLPPQHLAYRSALVGKDHPPAGFGGGSVGPRCAGIGGGRAGGIVRH